MIYEGAEIGFLLGFKSEASCSSQIKGDGTLSPCRDTLSGCQPGRGCYSTRSLRNSSLHEAGSLWKFYPLCSFLPKSWFLPRFPFCGHHLGSRVLRHSIPPRLCTRSPDRSSKHTLPSQAEVITGLSEDLNVSA